MPHATRRHLLATAADAVPDTQTLLLPLGSEQVQPVDVAYNSLNDRVYTCNRLTYTIGVVDTGPACPADLDASGTVDAGDIGSLLLLFGQSGTGDLDASGTVDAGDIGTLLLDFGPCAPAGA